MFNGCLDLVPIGTGFSQLEVSGGERGRKPSKIICIMSIVTWILIVINAATAVAQTKPQESFRLPDTILPFHYKIKLLTKLTDDFSYSGKVWIDVEALSDADKIVLNSKNLKIYENETTVEELSSAALENIFNAGKQSVKKKSKRSEETEKGDKKEVNAPVQTILIPQNSEGDKKEVNLKKVTGQVQTIFLPQTLEGDKKEVNRPVQTIFIPQNSEGDNKEVNRPVQTIFIPQNPEGDKKEVKRPVQTILIPQNSPVKISMLGEGIPQLSGIDIKDVKVTNGKPGSSPIKYIYYTFQKPSDDKTGALPVHHFGAPPGLMSGQIVANDESQVPVVTMIREPDMTPPAQSATVDAPMKMTTTKESSSVDMIIQQLTTANPVPMTDPKTTETPGEDMMMMMMPGSEEPAQMQPKPESHEYDQENNFLIINLSSPLVAGKKYRIQLRFKGTLSDSLSGYYRVAYRKRNSRKTSWLATTVFEPNEARSAFPCFDEPDFKATFDVALAHDKKFKALSNMPVKSTSPVEGSSDYQWTAFERTPRMSTYLVAFLISDLESISPKSVPKDDMRNTTYKFWARPDVVQRLKYAAKIVPDMKNHLENLLGVPDVMPKYDFVALPSFISNALENWGLVSFGERNILYTPGFSSVFNKFETTQILGHEVSHIWFGNLVTPKFWDQIWLSEGFSNFFEVVAADHVQPNWDVKTVSLIFSYLKVFSLDAMHSSHPLVPKIKNLNDMNEIFDSISYQKGYFIVRMLNYTLGEESFMKGLRRYLSMNKLSNVEESDLWDALTYEAHADGSLPKEYHLSDIMRSWTRRTGYPVVDVFRDYDNHTALVTQRRFLRPKFDFELRRNKFADDEPGDTKWWIPLTYTTGKELDFHNTKPRVWINPSDEETVLNDMPEENQFVLMNLEASGLYRVNYDEKNWELLVEFLLSDNYTDISIINRVQIIDDLLDFARAGELPYTTALEATNYLRKEKNFLPWKAALSNFEYISRMLRSTDSNRQFKRFMRSLVSERFEELGMEPKKGESIADAMNRKQIVKWACTTGHRRCGRKSLSMFRKWKKERKPDENNPIPSNIRSVVYCSAIAQGNAKDWQFLWNRYVNNVEITDKYPILYGLGCSKNTRTLRRLLDFSLNESSGIRKQDSVPVFKSVARNDVGFTIAKDFLRTRLGDIRNYLGNNPRYVSQMVESLASKMNQESDLSELQALEDEHFSKLRSSPRSIKQAKERVTFNIDWLEQNYDQITNWLKKQKF